MIYKGAEVETDMMSPPRAWCPHRDFMICWECPRRGRPRRGRPRQGHGVPTGTSTQGHHVPVWTSGPQQGCPQQTCLQRGCPHRDILARTLCTWVDIRSSTGRSATELSSRGTFLPRTSSTGMFSSGMWCPHRDILPRTSCPCVDIMIMSSTSCQHRDVLNGDRQGRPRQGRPRWGHHVRTGTSSMGTSSTGAFMSISTSAPSYCLCKAILFSSY